MVEEQHKEECWLCMSEASVMGIRFGMEAVAKASLVAEKVVSASVESMIFTLCGR